MTSAGQGGAATTTRGARWWVTRLLAVVGTVYLGVSAYGAVFGGDDSRGEVIRVVDGDTLVVLVDGEETTIRLLNIDTPETKHPDLPVQCLGPEATAFLEERLPAGTEIQLEYDEERTDRFGRTLAGVFESESLVNAEIAAAGLGVPVLFEPNARFLAEVEEASAEAQAEGRGLFAASIACTVAAQLEDVQTAVAQLPTEVTGDPALALAEAGIVVQDADDLVAGLAAGGDVILGNDVLTRSSQEDYLRGIREEADSAQRGATSAHTDLTTLKTAYDEEQIRLEKERLEAERLEAERLEAEREEESRRADEREAGSSSSGSSSSTSSSGTEKASSKDGETTKESTGSSAKKDSTKEKKKEKPAKEKPAKDEEKESSSGGCAPYGPEIPYDDDGGYTGKRYGMPGGETFRKCR